MSPLARAAAVYDREPCARTFEEDFRLHLQNGIVISTPTLFVMAREVPRAADSADIVNPAVRFPSAQCDAWMVYLFSGEISEVFQYCPSPKEWVAFERKNVLRWHRFESIRRRLTCTKTHFPTCTRAEPLSIRT